MQNRELLEEIEASGGQVAAQLAYLAVRGLGLGNDELAASRRRALLVLASGGDPRRELELGSRAVSVLAEDLDGPGRREELRAALARLREEAEGLEGAARTLDALLADDELAWRWACCALLAEELV